MRKIDELLVQLVNEGRLDLHEAAVITAALAMAQDDTDRLKSKGGNFCLPGLISLTANNKGEKK